MSVKKNSRLYNSILNVGTTVIVTVFSMLLSMLVRAFLNRTLGTQYVGVNGVLSSIISSLSIADLGVDSVFVYLLYKPLAEKDSDEISKLMILFKHVYVWIGSIFMILGIACMPFLKYLVGHEAMKIPHIYLVYVLFLLNTGLSYFFAAFRIILNADQKYYIIARITFIVSFTTNIIQIICLLTVNNFIIYVILMLSNTILINIIIGMVSIKRYKIKTVSNKKIREIKFKNDKTISTLIHNTIGGISNKLGIIVVNSSDNILLANFETLKIVGMYSNYLLVTNGITSLLLKAIASITATIGNLGVESDETKNLSVFIRLNFLINTLVIFTVIPLSLFFGVFVNIWIGREGILSEFATILIVTNCLLTIIRYPSLTFIDAFGLQWIQRWKSVIESIVNIVVSLTLLYFFKLGLIGVLLGTLVSNIFVVNWYEPYLVLKEVCGKRYKEYLTEIVPQLLIFVGALVYAMIILKSNIIEYDFGTSLKIILSSEAFLVLIYVAIFHKNKDVSFFVRTIRKVLQRSK